VTPTNASRWLARSCRSRLRRRQPPRLRRAAQRARRQPALEQRAAEAADIIAQSVSLMALSLSRLCPTLWQRGQPCYPEPNKENRETPHARLHISKPRVAVIGLVRWATAWRHRCGVQVSTLPAAMFRLKRSRVLRGWRTWRENTGGGRQGCRHCRQRCGQCGAD